MNARTLSFVASLLATFLLPGGAAAQGAAGFPVKPIRIIVPFTPGGPADAVARPIAQGLTERMGQQAIVDYRAGAGGSIGAETLAKAPHDGYTIMVTTPGIVAVYPAMVSKAPFDTLRDFTGVTNAITTAPETRERLVKQGLEPVGNTPEEFDAFIRSEIAKWSRIVKQAGIKPD